MSDLTTSPLASAAPDSLAVLFERDPLTLTEADFERVVAEIRAARDKWQLQEKKGKKVAASGTITLEDLGL